MTVATIQRKQTTNVIMITFWSQFASYALNTILILFLTRPLIAHGLGYNQTKAYAFIGISSATGYLMPILGGYMADKVLGVRRSILLSSTLLAFAYLLVMISGLTIQAYDDTLFLMAYALIPAANSLLMGTASAMVSRIYNNEATKAKSAMTFYYMAINVGALLATILAPSLLDSRYGPLSVLAVTFVGKAIAALNFASRYALYDPIIWGKDTHPLSTKALLQVVMYLLILYFGTLFAYSHIAIASIFISVGCLLGLIWFFTQTLLLKGVTRIKQMIALILIIEAIVFFIIYNQMNTTLIMFAKYHSNTHLFGFTLSPAHYQLLNPLLIITVGMQLPRFYRKFPKFSVPYQFACGTLLASFALLLLALAPSTTPNGMISGAYIASTYILITIGELWVSAIGLSMIGLYCDTKTIGFAMGAWYLGCSLSNICSGHIARWVAMPDTVATAFQDISLYQHYYLYMGMIALCISGLMLSIAYYLHKAMRQRNIVLT